MRALVTGGGGFLGGAIVAELLRRGHDASSVSRGDYPELRARGVATIRGDLADPATADRAVAGHDTVFHVAAKAGVWGPRRAFVAANVDATRHVIEACRRHGVVRLVHTSSPSVCFDGRDHRAAGPDLPYAPRFTCAYPETKAEAERLVLAANDPTLATCALRPHLVFGPGDPHLVPRLLERGRRGRLAIVGAGTNEVSLTYVENAAAAHVDAAEALTPGAPHAGRAYFIAQEEPVRLWDWVNGLFARVGVERVTRRVPYRAAWMAGGLLEVLWKALPLGGEPPMTRFVATQLARDHSYDLTPARRDFGYRERVGMDEATERLVASLREA